MSEFGSTDMASHAHASPIGPAARRSNNPATSEALHRPHASAQYYPGTLRHPRRIGYGLRNHLRGLPQAVAGQRPIHGTCTHRPSHKLRSFRPTCGRTNRIAQYMCYKKIIQQYAPVCLRAPRLTRAILPSIHPPIRLSSSSFAMDRAVTRVHDLCRYSWLR